MFLLVLACYGSKMVAKGEEKILRIVTYLIYYLLPIGRISQLLCFRKNEKLYPELDTIVTLI